VVQHSCKGGLQDEMTGVGAMLLLLARLPHMVCMLCTMLANP
jgi:hypothetical protein